MGILKKPLTTTTAEGRRLALLICNGQFSCNPQWNLPGVAQDAKKIRDVLAQPDLCGFKVSVVLNGGLVEVRRAIAKLCKSAQENDTLLIYYSGQGTLGQDQRLHLLVADSDSEYYLATGLEPDFILDQLREAHCRSIVLFVDTCHAGAFFNGNQGIPNGFYAISSCGASELSNETQEGGAFSCAIIDGLRGAAADQNGDGRVTVQELHNYVKKVMGKPHPDQHPQKWEWNVPGPIYLTIKQRPVFLSYSRNDSELAISLQSALEADGLSVWMDTDDIRSGEWKDKIFEGLKNARACLFLMTASSLNSEWVRKEVDFAASKEVPLIPVQIGKPNIPDWFNFDYGRLHRYFFDPQDPVPTIEGIKNAIHDTSIRIANATDHINCNSATLQ